MAKAQGWEMTASPHHSSIVHAGAMEKCALLGFELLWRVLQNVDPALARGCPSGCESDTGRLLPVMSRFLAKHAFS